MGGTHPDDPRPPVSPRARRLALLVLVPIAVLTLLGLVLLWPDSKPVQGPDGPDRVSGRVVEVHPAACPELPEMEEPAADVGPGECGTVTVELTDSPRAGERITADLPFGPGAITVGDGDKVVLLHLPDALSGQPYSIVDHQRSTPLWLLGAAFAAAVIAFGRWRGLRALAGLGVTFAVLLFFIVPAILDGRSPLLVAIVGSAAIMLTVLYLTHGFSLTTTIAVAGTLASLTITAALSALATTGTRLSGIADETSTYLTLTHGEVNMRGLLLAGIVIGSLGVLDDVTVTQSTTVAELARANATYGFRQLYRAATRVGRAHIASVINTIVLAYAGASLPLMLLFAAGNDPIGELLTSELIAQELVRSAVGTLGLIAAVPITTALAAALAARGNAVAVPAGPASGPPAPRTAQRPDARPPADPWMAFVERGEPDRG
ncbi:MAG TPA: YibE/F family protein [Micromonosporaceae bacterium]|nr:YibE/F family protein [Micromonosporaceae bacterium]